MIISNKITICKNHKFYNQILNYCKNELTLDNQEYIKRQRMGKWLGNLPKHIRHYELINDNIIVGFGCIDYIKKNGWVDGYKLDMHESPTMDWQHDLKLYDYQQECSDKMVKAKHGIFIAPAGSGKTNIAIDIILRLGKKTLILTHTRDLLKQAKDRIRSLTGIEAGEITDGKVDIRDITISTVQTLSKFNLQKYAYIWGTVVVDECHRIANGGPTTQAMFSEILGNLKCLNKIGMTATLHRASMDEKAITFLLGDVVHEVSKEAVADKTLKADIKIVHVDFELSRDCLDTDGTVIFAKAVNEIAFSKTRNELIAEHIKSCKGKSCLVLSDRLDQLRELTEMVGYGVMIDGTMTSKKGKVQREQAIDDMRSGKETVLYASYSLAKEGLDLPRLTRLFMTTPKKDYAVVVQSVGRIERTFEGKTEAIVYDFVDSNWLGQAMYKERKRIYKKNGNILIDF